MAVFLLQEQQFQVTAKRPLSKEKHKTRAKSAGTVCVRN